MGGEGGRMGGEGGRREGEGGWEEREDGRRGRKERRRGRMGGEGGRMGGEYTLTLVLQKLSRRFNITNLFYAEILSRFKAPSMDRAKG